MSRVVVALCAAGLLAVEPARGLVVEPASPGLDAGAHDAALCNESMMDAEGRPTLKLHVKRLPVSGRTKG